MEEFWSREWELNPRPADCSRNSMLLNRLAFSCVLHHGFTWYSGLTVPFLFPKDLFSSQYQQSDSHQTGELERLMLCGRLLREASPSPLCEVIPVSNLTATNAPKESGVRDRRYSIRHPFAAE